MDRYDVTAFLGLAIAAAGCGMIYVPLGLIVFGGGLAIGSLFGAWASMRQRGKAR